MTGLWALVRRDTKLYFKDKGMFFSSLITPIILLVLTVLPDLPDLPDLLEQTAFHPL